MQPMLRLLKIISLAVALPSAAQSATFYYVATLSGPAESPPNASPGTGTAAITVDDTAHSLRVQSSFANLTGNTIAAHIHAPTALPGEGVAAVATQVPTFIDFPLGVTSGSYDKIFDTLAAPTYNPSFVTAQGGTAARAEAALFRSLGNGTAYFNIHTTTFGGGEIRGFVAPIPEPST